jgi:hypothetical protein
MRSPCESTRSCNVPEDGRSDAKDHVRQAARDRWRGLVGRVEERGGRGCRVQRRHEGSEQGAGVDTLCPCGRRNELDLSRFSRRQRARRRTRRRRPPLSIAALGLRVVVTTGGVRRRSRFQRRRGDAKNRGGVRLAVQRTPCSQRWMRHQQREHENDDRAPHTSGEYIGDRSSVQHASCQAVMTAPVRLTARTTAPRCRREWHDAQGPEGRRPRCCRPSCAGCRSDAGSRCPP